MARQHVHAHPDPQPPAVARSQVVGHLPVGHLAVAHGGDARGQECFLGLVEPGVEGRRLVGEVEVGAVVGDFHPGRPGQQVARRVEHSPERVAAAVPVDQAAGRGGGGRGDAGPGQRMRVGHVAVPARVHDHHRPVGGHPVEVGCAGVAVLGQPVLVVAEPPDRGRGPQPPARGTQSSARRPQSPDCGRRPQSPDCGRGPQSPDRGRGPQSPDCGRGPQSPDCGRGPESPAVFSQQLHHLVHAGSAGQVGPAGALAVHERVGVGVDEPRHQAPPV